MTLAVVLTLMALAAALALAWPLVRRRQPAVTGRAAYERALYRDQLDEVARDVVRGVLTEHEADAARAEIERRALTALERDTYQSAPRRAPFGRAVTTALAIALPAAAGVLYFVSGRPDLPGQPYAERTRMPELTSEQRRAGLETMIAMMKERLQAEPRDAQAWNLIARVHRRLGREAETQAMYEAALAKADNPARRAAIALAYGEALLRADDGIMSAKSKAAFDTALAAEPQNVGARFYQGLWRLQSGDARGALEIWVQLERQAPEGAPYLESLRARIARVAEEFGLDPAGLGTDESP